MFLVITRAVIDSLKVNTFVCAVGGYNTLRHISFETRAFMCQAGTRFFLTSHKMKTNKCRKIYHHTKVTNLH